MTSNDAPSVAGLDGGKERLVTLLDDAVGGHLRDVWVLDQHAQEPLYLREDVEAKISEVDVDRHLDNERYGFVTRDTYDELHYSEFMYTHRGFDTWELFRTFVVDDDATVGVVVGLDANGGSHDFNELTEDIRSLADEHGVAALAPAAGE